MWVILSIHLNCVWAPSVNAINTESTSFRPAAVLCSVGVDHSPPIECNSLIWDVEVETGLWQKCGTTVVDFTFFGQHESRLSTSFSYDQTLSRSSLKPSWISTTLIPSLCLPVAVELVRLDGQKTLWASIVSKSADLNPKHPFTSPILVTVFLPGAKKENVA